MCRQSGTDSKPIENKKIDRGLASWQRVMPKSEDLQKDSVNQSGKRVCLSLVEFLSCIFRDCKVSMRGRGVSQVPKEAGKSDAERYARPPAIGDS